MYRFILLFVCLCFSCAPQNGDAPFDYGFNVGSGDKELFESSGLVSSIRNPGLLWTHNDSGNDERLFLIDSLGNTKSIVWLEGAINIDWEDIAIGPGPIPANSYLYIADIGDNQARRKTKTIYRLTEPLSADTIKTIAEFDSITFVLEDKEKDTEAMVIDPLTKDIYVFSKRERTTIYKLKYPQLTTTLDTARIVGKLPFSTVIAADISSSGSEVLIKTYKSVYYWKRKGSEPIEELLETKFTILPYEPEQQGEAVAFSLDGSGYYTSSEVPKGERVPLKFYPRKKSSGTPK